MSIAITPFTKQQLLPQEEKLEVAEKRSFIGILRKPATKNAVFVSLRCR
jgi:hypothetical protein